MIFQLVYVYFFLTKNYFEKLQISFEIEKKNSLSLSSNP